MFDFIKEKYYNTKNVQNLADIIIFGNTNEIINKVFLNKIVNSNNTVHSYMFEGIEGIGKSVFAKEFAKMLLCTGENKTNCNGTCESCDCNFNHNTVTLSLSKCR